MLFRSLESCGVDYVSIIVDGGRNSGMPQFNDLEIDALPVPMIGLWEMEEYGYTWNEMLPLTQGRASDFLAMTCLYTCSMRTALKQPCMTGSRSQGMGESSA